MEWEPPADCGGAPVASYEAQTTQKQNLKLALLSFCLSVHCMLLFFFSQRKSDMCAPDPSGRDGGGHLRGASLALIFASPLSFSPRSLERCLLSLSLILSLSLFSFYPLKIPSLCIFVLLPVFKEESRKKSLSVKQRSGVRLGAQRPDPQRGGGRQAPGPGGEERAASCAAPARSPRVERKRGERGDVRKLRK